MSTYFSRLLVSTVENQEFAATLPRTVHTVYEADLVYAARMRRPDDGIEFSTQCDADDLRHCLTVTKPPTPGAHIVMDIEHDERNPNRLEFDSLRSLVPRVSRTADFMDGLCEAFAGDRYGCYNTLVTPDHEYNGDLRRLRASIARILYRPMGFNVFDLYLPYLGFTRWFESWVHQVFTTEVYEAFPMRRFHNAPNFVFFSHRARDGTEIPPDDLESCIRTIGRYMNPSVGDKIVWWHDRTSPIDMQSPAMRRLASLVGVVAPPTPTPTTPNTTPNGIPAIALGVGG